MSEIVFSLLYSSTSNIPNIPLIFPFLLFGLPLPALFTHGPVDILPDPSAPRALSLCL